MMLFIEIFGMLLIVIALYLLINHIYNSVLNVSDKRQALDYLPVPVYFGLSGKYPLVVNDKMYELMYSCKKKPLTDMSKDFEYLEKSRLTMDEIGEKLALEYGNAFFVQYGGKVYGIDRREIQSENETITQIIGQDITEEYDNLCKLIELNDKLKEQNERLRRHFDNIAEVNKDRELLNAKIAIHANFGNSLTVTRQVLKSHSDIGERERIIALWKQIILGFSDPENAGFSTNSGYEELMRISKTVGCEMIIKGSLPQGAAMPFMVKVIREALNNAIRHANATALTIDLESFSSNGTVYIYDNGIPKAQFTKPGGGLSSLKKYLEENGILFGVNCVDRFEIQLLFPDAYRR